MAGSVLFISDDSVFHPVLRSQGLPILRHLSATGVSCAVVSFERRKIQDWTEGPTDRILKDLSPHLSVKMIPLHSLSVLPDWFSMYSKGLLECWRIVRDSRIKVVHARSFMPAMIALSLKRIFGPAVKVIYDYRGVFIEEQVYLGHWDEKSMKVRLAHRIERSNLAAADSIVVVSKALKSYLVGLYASKIQDIEKKITVISNKTRILPKRVGKERSLAGKKRIMGVYSGSAAAWQSVPEMTQFCTVAVENFQRFSFTILTYEDKSSFLEHFAKEKNLLKCIKIISSRSGEVVPQLAVADFGILLREDHLVNRVSSPLKFAEYLASGIPVVASEGIGDTEEIIKKYEVGIVVRNRDYHAAIVELLILLKDKSLRKRCYEAARKEFNIEDAISAYYTIYSQLLEKS